MDPATHRLIPNSAATTEPPAIRPRSRVKNEEGYRYPADVRCQPINSHLSNAYESARRAYRRINLAEGGRPEDDDWLHDPDPRKDRNGVSGGLSVFSLRGLANFGCIVVLYAGILALFAGYPLISAFTAKRPSIPESDVGGLNLGPARKIPGRLGPIDDDTPQEVRTKVDYVTGQTWELVFSDEFNVEGRYFYPGDDPYWEAVDLHYWPTGNLEWYDPSTITTRDGALEITLSEHPNHGLDYMGGMMSTWNKFCFTGGLVEASVVLPGANNVAGLWPAIWAMGNLGRAGYGATTDGMWPYTYDACDVGTAPNQTFMGLPVESTMDNDEHHGGALSYLPGQRLSRCTCLGESHPGPVHENGEYVGRSAPEIDMFEAQIGGSPMGDGYGAVSQSGQWAPFNYQYNWNNNSETMMIQDSSLSGLNIYQGGAYQQATSVVTATKQTAYELNGGEFSTYGFQYKPGFGDAYLAWITDGKLAWTMTQAGVGPDPISNISARPVPQEPMYLIMNLGISPEFVIPDFENLQFPTTMRVDWIRVYQDPDALNLGCDPPDFPTRAYIKAYEEAYFNPNLTTWVDDYKQPMPKNKFLGEC
ncbi:glycoside hydrolase family 16 protein [Earliella scabrosa]|nr:glycoside hydrolase family 16 protein [Earliella scabrosa]